MGFLVSGQQHEIEEMIDDYFRSGKMMNKRQVTGRSAR
jgi:hypothetical protein